MLTIDLEINRLISLDVRGRLVEFCEYEPSNEGDFVKVCTHEHSLGVAGEYAWVQNKYPNAIMAGQKLTSIQINKQKVKCDILTIKTVDGKTKNVYFDISQMMENLDNKATGKTDRKHWDTRAKRIYDTLSGEHGFLVDGTDEENLYKNIDENVNIVFDIAFFFGFVIKNKHLDTLTKTKYINTIKKYATSGFIRNEVFEGALIGGYICIDNLDDMNLVFDNYKSLEEEAAKIKAGTL